MHRYRREAPVQTSTPLLPFQSAASFALIVTVAVWGIGAALVAAGVLPGTLAALKGPIMLILAVSGAASWLAQAIGTVREAKPLRYSRASVNLAVAGFLAGQFGRAAGLWPVEGAFIAMLAAAGVVGAALLADAVRDARRHAYPRLAVISSALGGTGLLMLAVSELTLSGSAVLNRLFLLGLGMLAAAAFGVVRLQRIHRSRAELLARMGLGD